MAVSLLMHVDFFLSLLFISKFFIGIGDSNFLLFPVFGSDLVSFSVLHDSLEDLDSFAHLLMESLLDSVQVEVKVLSEASDECDDLLDVVLEVNFPLVFCDKQINKVSVKIDRSLKIDDLQKAMIPLE